MIVSMKQQIQKLLEQVLEDMGLEGSVIPQVSVPENPAHGDYSTNVAMLLSKALKKSSAKIAEELKDLLQKHQTISGAGIVDRVEVAGPGFVNLFLSEASLSGQVAEVLKRKDTYGSGTKIKKNEGTGYRVQGTEAKKREQKKEKSIAPQSGEKSAPLTTPNPPIFPRTTAAVDYAARQNGSDAQVLAREFISADAKKRILVEFAHPNTHKAFHIGHLRNITTGESVVRLLESQGHEVIRANYQGDVGMHIAKALYALTTLAPYKDQVRSVSGIHERVEFLGKAYAAGSKAYEEDETAKKEIETINKKIYARDPSVFSVYQETRQWSLDYFDSIYKRVDSHFDRLYFESEVYETGKKNVLDGVKKGIFEENDGAVIFPGEKYGLHTRVFITKEGNATYEGKDMGLAPLQHAEYHPDFIVHVLGPEQFTYTRVMFQALDLLFPQDAGKQYHLVYGWVRLKKGKMSSRLGNVVLGEWLLDEAKKSIYKILDKNISSPIGPQGLPRSGISLRETLVPRDLIAEKAAVAAVKYSFLRVGISSDISFDLEASVSFDGDSGPYLQYTYARCKSVLRKSSVIASEAKQSVGIAAADNGLAMTLNERLLARLLVQFPDVVSDAAANFAPNTICTYLFHLAQEFNTFYAKNPILGSGTRLSLTAATAQVIKNGLYLLGIETLEKM